MQKNSKKLLSILLAVLFLLSACAIPAGAADIGSEIADTATGDMGEPDPPTDTIPLKVNDSKSLTLTKSASSVFYSFVAPENARYTFSYDYPDSQAASSSSGTEQVEIVVYDEMMTSIFAFDPVYDTSYVEGSYTLDGGWTYYIQVTANYFASGTSKINGTLQCNYTGKLASTTGNKKITENNAVNIHLKSSTSSPIFRFNPKETNYLTGLITDFTSDSEDQDAACGMRLNVYNSNLHLVDRLYVNIANDVTTYFSWFNYYDTETYYLVPEILEGFGFSDCTFNLTLEEANSDYETDLTFDTNDDDITMVSNYVYDFDDIDRLNSLTYSEGRIINNTYVYQIYFVSHTTLETVQPKKSVDIYVPISETDVQVYQVDDAMSAATKLNTDSDGQFLHFKTKSSGYIVLTVPDGDPGDDPDDDVYYSTDEDNVILKADPITEESQLDRLYQIAFSDQEMLSAYYLYFVNEKGKLVSPTKSVDVWIKCDNPDARVYLVDPGSKTSYDMDAAYDDMNSTMYFNTTKAGYYVIGAEASIGTDIVYDTKESGVVMTAEYADSETIALLHEFLKNDIEDGKEITDAYDINFISAKDGSAVTPKQYVNVWIPTIYSNAELWYISSDFTEASLLNSTYENGTINFVTKWPGYYALVVPSDDEPFEFYYFRLGDANDNDKVDIADVTMIQRFIARYDMLTDEFFTLRSDIDENGILDITDATYIQRYLSKIKIPYDIGGYVEYNLNDMIFTSWPVIDHFDLTTTFGEADHIIFRDDTIDGAEVCSELDGTVTAVYKDCTHKGKCLCGGGLGNYVTIKSDNGIEITYAHLSSVTVNKGDYLISGATIGFVGSSGSVTEPQLYIKCVQNGVAIDPLSVL